MKWLFSQRCASSPQRKTSVPRRPVAGQRGLLSLCAIYRRLTFYQACPAGRGSSSGSGSLMGTDGPGASPGCPMPSCSAWWCAAIARILLRNQVDTLRPDAADWHVLVRPAAVRLQQTATAAGTLISAKSTALAWPRTHRPGMTCAGWSIPPRCAECHGNRQTQRSGRAPAMAIARRTRASSGASACI